MVTTFQFRGKDIKVLLGKTHQLFSISSMWTEEEEFRNKYWNIKPLDIVFDVGASFGAYTLSALSEGATVYAFEPEPTIFETLVANVEENNFPAPAHLLDHGLWSSFDTADMKIYAPHWPAHTITKLYDMATLDFVSRGLNRIDWLKIDVEGCEEEVINGGKEALRKFKPKLIIECHDFLDPDIKIRIKNSLRFYNFEEIPRGDCSFLIGESK